MDQRSEIKQKSFSLMSILVYYISTKKELRKGNTERKNYNLPFWKDKKDNNLPFLTLQDLLSGCII